MLIFNLILKVEVIQFCSFNKIFTFFAEISGCFDINPRVSHHLDALEFQKFLFEFWSTQIVQLLRNSKFPLEKLKRKVLANDCGIEGYCLIVRRLD